MDVKQIVSQIDAEIARLQTARAAVAKLGPTAVIVRGRGRPKGTTNKVSVVKKKRTMTPEGRARIAAAVKLRWAKQKKAKKATPVKK